ncbi:MAG: DUF3127 domain-containing protein [bacterium]
MEISGKIIQILPVQSGKSARGEWKKQEFIIETEEQFPRKVCLVNWGDKINLDDFSENESITASVNIESREYNGRWYTDIKVWKMDKAAANQNMPGDHPPPPPPPENFDEGDENNIPDDLPF